MFFLLIVILTSASINIAFKVFQRLGIDSMQAIIFNYVTATTVGLLISPVSYSPSEMISQGWFYTGIVLGASFFITMNLYSISTKYIGVALTTLLSRTSLVIPTIMAFFLFDEKISFRMIAAIVMIVIALFFIFYTKSTTTGVKKEGNKKILIYLLPLIVFFMCGLNDAMIKGAQFIFIKNSADNAAFISTVFFTALVIGVTSYIAMGRYKTAKFTYKSLLGGIFLGGVNLASSMSILAALKSIPASVTFPIVNVGIVLISTIVGIFFFKEQLTKKKIAGIIIAVVAIALMSV